MERCFADNGDGCDALSRKQCAGCAFYKTAEQLECERAASKAILFTQGQLAEYQEKYEMLREHGTPVRDENDRFLIGF